MIRKGEEYFLSLSLISVSGDQIGNCIGMFNEEGRGENATLLKCQSSIPLIGWYHSGADLLSMYSSSSYFVTVPSHLFARGENREIRKKASPFYPPPPFFFFVAFFDTKDRCDIFLRAILLCEYVCIYIFLNMSDCKCANM